MKNPVNSLLSIANEVLKFNIDFIADLPIGDIISNKAIICIQLNGIFTCSFNDMKISVYGNNKNTVNAIKNKIALIILLFLIISPMNKVAEAAGRKSQPRNIGGFPNTNPKNVPNIILANPTVGPRKIP